MKQKIANMASGETTSVLMALTVKEGQNQEFWSVMNRIRDVLTGFPGFLTLNHLPTKNSEGAEEYLTILQFDNAEALVSWEQSEQRVQLLDEIHDYVEDDYRRKSVTGLEGLFSSPTPLHPVKYKMSIVLIVVMFAMLAILRLLFGNTIALTSDSLTSQTFSPYLQTFIYLAIQVPIATYWVMPKVTRKLSFWLYKKKI